MLFSKWFKLACVFWPRVLENCFRRPQLGLKAEDGGDRAEPGLREPRPDLLSAALPDQAAVFEKLAEKIVSVYCGLVWYFSTQNLPDDFQ